MMRDVMEQTSENASQRISLRGGFYGVLIAGLALVPLVAQLTGASNWISFSSQIMIFAIAAISLNLVLGYGGMISFGHAAFIAIGGYSVGIAIYYDLTNGYLHLAMAIGFSALFALVTGAISLRTRGVYFIMITLAFAQMVYFAFVSMEEFGGDDGLTINSRSEFGGLFDLENELTLYYVVFFTLLATLYVIHRIVNSRFGWVIRGAKSNDIRMQALGHPVYRYRLTCYVIGGVMCGIAGFLFANYANFINPEDAAWTTSGELIFMVVLGGMGTLFGPVLGAILFFLMEEVVGSLPVVGLYWKIYFGPFLVLVVLYARGGIDSWLEIRLAGASKAAKALVAAPVATRLLATAIDVALVALSGWLLIAVLGTWLMSLPSETHHQQLAMIVSTYLFLAGVFVNFLVLPASRWRGSIGKIVTGLAVVGGDGRMLSPEQAVQRVFGQLLSIGTLLVGYLWMFRDPERRALHDHLAATRVIVQEAHDG